MSTAQHDGVEEPGKEPEPTASNNGNSNGGGGNGFSAGGISADEAERLASQFRPSWEPPEATWSAAPAPAVVPAPAPVPAPLPAPVTPMPVAAAPEVAQAEYADTVPALPPSEAYEIDDPVLPKQKMGRATMAMLAIGAIALIAVVVGLVTSGGSPDADEIEDGEAASASETGTATPALEPAPTPAPAQEEAAAAAPAPAPVPAEETTAPPTPAPPAQISVRIRTVPADALLSIDGRRVDNPYQESVDRGDAGHSVLATATGHSSAHRVVRFNADVDLELTLEREAVREPPPRVARRRPAAMRATAMRAPAMRATATTTTTTMRRGSGFVSTSPY